MPVTLRFLDLDLKPGLAAGAVTRAGPVRLADYAAVSALVEFARGFGGGVPSSSVFTLQTGVAGNLQTIDASIVSATTVGVGSAVRVKDAEQAVGDLWLTLTTEEPGASPPYRGDLTITIRTRQDELEGRGSERPAAAQPPLGAEMLGGGSAPAGGIPGNPGSGGGSENPAGQGAPSGGGSSS